MVCSELLLAGWSFFTACHRRCSTRRILVTGVSKKDPGQLQGRTENNRAVNFSTTDQALIGQFVDVEIVDALPNSLRGVLLDS